MERDDSFVSLEFWDTIPQYFPWFETLESIVDFNALVEGRPVLINDSIRQQIPKDIYQRTEGDRIVVLPDCVYWECRPKHCDYLTIETAELRKEHLLR